MLGNLKEIRKSLLKNWESSEVFGLVNSWAVWPLTTILVFWGCSCLFRGCSGVWWDVPGVFQGCSRLFRGVLGVFWGCSGGVPGCSGCSRSVSGFTDTFFNVFVAAVKFVAQMQKKVFWSFCTFVTLCFRTNRCVNVQKRKRFPVTVAASSLVRPITINYRITMNQ